MARPGLARWGPPAGVAAGLLALVIWLLWPLGPWLGTAILGEPGSDALRAMWGLDHLRRSILPPNTPIWSSEAGFPAGVVALPLPFVSGLLLAPLGVIFGPVAGYNLALGALLWAAGLGAAALVRALGGGWGPGLAAGAAWIASPMLLHAIADGTAEHAAVWLLPGFLALAAGALQRGGVRAGAWAGVVGGLVALDSPYLAIYAVIATLGLAPMLRAAQGRAARGFALGAAPFAVLLLAIYRQFPLGSDGGLPLEQLQALNATHLPTWATVWAQGHQPGDPTPTAIPRGLLAGGLALGLAGGRRAWAWLGVAALMVLLSFGRSDTLPIACSINEQLYRLPGVGGLRFPERWLVPASLALAVAGALGLGRGLASLRAGPGLRAGVCAVLALGAFAQGARDSGLRRDLPLASVPDPSFAAWLREQSGSGAYALLPQVRPAAPVGAGARPVFAGLGSAYTPADAELIQVRVGRPSTGAPGLQTLARRDEDPRVLRLLSDWDDLTHPALTGYPIPPGADDPRADRVRGEALDLLIDAGLRWLIIDEAAYAGAGLDALRRQLGDRLTEERRFDEGTGVLVWEIQ